MPGHLQPVAGYRSAAAAIVALTLAGEDIDAIAAKVGKPRLAIQQEQCRLRRLGRLPATDTPRKGRKPRTPRPPSEPEDSRGIWSTEKIAKVRGVTMKALEIIAEAYQVPAKEVLSLIVSGTTPPIGKRQRVAQLVEERTNAGLVRPSDNQPVHPQPPALPAPPAAAGEPETGRVGQGVEPPAEAVPAVPAEPLDRPDAAPVPAGEPSREDDEAELAALSEIDEVPDGVAHAPAAEEGEGEVAVVSPSPVPPAPRTYRLKQPHGDCWVHRDTNRFTTKRAEAWTGAAPDMERLFSVFPKYRDLDPERVPAKDVK